MNLNYMFYHSLPDADILLEILELHKSIFKTSDDLINKMVRTPKLLVITAMDDKKVIGYKIGYELNKDKFYSWLGGVDINYRKSGIATKLMEKQHLHLKSNGYSIVQTKTMNKWRGMLVLNIKCGFDIIETYVDSKGLHKIVLEKSLLR